jgi:hypothetical protein
MTKYWRVSPSVVGAGGAASVRHRLHNSEDRWNETAGRSFFGDRESIKTPVATLQRRALSPAVEWVWAGVCRDDGTKERQRLDQALAVVGIGAFGCTRQDVGEQLFKGRCRPFIGQGLQRLLAVPAQAQGFVGGAVAQILVQARQCLVEVVCR